MNHDFNSAHANVALSFVNVVLLILLPFLSGCGTMMLDRVRSGSPKGYALFYVDNLPTKHPFYPLPVINWHNVNVYEYGKYGGFNVGWVGDGLCWFSWYPEKRLQISLSPGMHTFGIRKGTFQQDINVNIVEGMITPVKIIVSIQNMQHSYNRDEITFWAHVEIGSPVSSVKPE